MMPMRAIRWLFSLVLAGFVAGSVVKHSGIGIWKESSEGSYSFGAGTYPWVLVLSAIALGLYILLLQAQPAIHGERLPGVLRRYFAFWIDFLLAAFVSNSVVDIVAILVEWRRTGDFLWVFERTAPAPEDSFLVAIGMFLTVISLLCWIAIPLMRGRPTPGSCIAGYQVIADEGMPLKPIDALLRSLINCVGLGVGILVPFVGRDRALGKIWLDKICNTHAVKLQ